jgi:hypothetical protein
VGAGVDAGKVLLSQPIRRTQGRIVDPGNQVSRELIEITAGLRRRTGALVF